MKVNVALGELPQFPSWDQDGEIHRGMVAISPSIEYLETAWDDAKHGRPSEHPYVEAMFPTAHEEGLAPEGKHILLAFTQFGPYEVRDGSWDTEREACGRRVIKTLGEFSPNLEGAVEEIEVLARRISRSGSAWSGEHLPGGDEPQPDVLPPADPRLRGLSDGDRRSVPVRGRYASRRRHHGHPWGNAAQMVKPDAKHRSMTLSRRSLRRAGVDM